MVVDKRLLVPRRNDPIDYNPQLGCGVAFPVASATPRRSVEKMNLERHISHYFEREYGPFLSICDLDSEGTEAIIERERDAKTGFNRFSYGTDFFEFRKLADDLLLELYSKKFGKDPERRPYYGVLGDADVVGGLFRDPYKVQIPLDYFSESEITFMCPDHFHLVGLRKANVKRYFGYQPPEDYREKTHPYFGKLLTYQELETRIHELKIDSFLAENRRTNHWYRYVEAQVWADPLDMKSQFDDWMEVDPESWTFNGVTHLQNYKEIEQNKVVQTMPASRTRSRR